MPSGCGSTPSNRCSNPATGSERWSRSSLSKAPPSHGECHSPGGIRAKRSSFGTQVQTFGGSLRNARPASSSGARIRISERPSSRSSVARNRITCFPVRPPCQNVMPASSTRRRPRNNTSARSAISAATSPSGAGSSSAEPAPGAANRATSTSNTHPRFRPRSAAMRAFPFGGPRHQVIESRERVEVFDSLAHRFDRTRDDLLVLQARGRSSNRDRNPGVESE